MTIALLLQRRGYKVTIFESRNQIGGVLRYGIPEYRLPKRIIDLLEKHLLDLGVKIRPNILIGPVLSLDKLFEDGYAAAFIGTGVWKLLSVREMWRWMRRELQSGMELR